MTQSIQRRGAASPVSSAEPRTESPAERERRLAALADAKDTDGLRAALADTNAVQLRQTLETSARRGTLGAVVRAHGLDELLALGKARGVDVNEVLASTDTVTERGLTAREARRIRENFGNTLDPDTLRLVFTKGAQTMGAGAMALGNTIHVDPTDPRWKLARGTTRPLDVEDDSWNGFNTVVFAHEASHAWSYQHRGTAYAFTSVTEQLQGIAGTGSRGAAYGYRPDRPSFFAYGEEQRAMLVQDFVAATNARRKGQAQTPTMYGGWQPVDDVLKTLSPFIAQMRAAGPGQPRPPDAPSPSPCAGFTQDGLADLVARSTDRAVAGVGAAAKDALIDGAAHARPGVLVAGAAGVVAAGVAAVVSREQNATGATGGGSALLDQAGLPRGVDVQTKDGVRLGVKGAWDAPAPKPGAPLTLGAANARAEWHLGADVPLADDVTLAADARATVGLDGAVREVSGQLGVRAPSAQANARVRVQPERATDAPLRVDAEVDATTPGLSVTADAHVEARDGAVQRADVSARVDTRAASGGVTVSAKRGGEGMELERADADLSVTPSPGVSVGARASLLPAGIDAVAATLAVQGDQGALALEASGRALTTRPTVSVAATVSLKDAPVTVGARVETTPSTGETTAGVELTVRF